MNKKGIIFDLDGVIVDTAKYHFSAWNNLAKELDIHFTEKENEQLKGVSRIESLKKILLWGNKSISEKHFEELLHKKNEEYLGFVNVMDESEILPGVLERLKMLKDQGFPVALGSASKNAKTILERVNLMPYFDAIVDGNEVSKAKPDPEVFLKAAKLLKVQPIESIVFEDAIAGIDAANAANMISIGIGEKSILNKADFVFADFTEITDVHFNEILNKIKVQN